MFDDDDIIFAYTRAEALEDGVLVDVSQLAHEAGFAPKLPVAITAALHGDLSENTNAGDEYTGRLHYVLWYCVTYARIANQKGFQGSVLHPKVAVNGVERTLHMEIHAGDHHEPVMTIGYPSDF